MTGTKYYVSAREVDGFTTYGRAGEAWPRDPDAPREVLVVDQDEDPPGRQLDGKLAIGQATLAVLVRDAQLVVEPAGPT